MLHLMFVQIMFQFGAKVGNRRANTGRKITLTCSFLRNDLFFGFSLHAEVNVSQALKCCGTTS